MKKNYRVEDKAAIELAENKLELARKQDVNKDVLKLIRAEIKTARETANKNFKTDRVLAVKEKRKQKELRIYNKVQGEIHRSTIIPITI